MQKNGAVNFVVHKINSKNHPREIVQMLARMGFDHVEISSAFIEAGKSIDKLYQELISSNDFLPTLNENLEDYFKEGNIKIILRLIPVNSDKIGVPPKTLSPYPAPAPFITDYMKRNKGIEMTRHSFAFKFLYALSMVVLGVAIAFVFAKISTFFFIWQNPTFPAMLAIIFGLYVLQLFARRLQNAGMSPWLTILLFTPLAVILTGNYETQIFILSCIPILGVFIIAMLTPSHRYRL